MKPEIPDVDSDMRQTAVSVYGNDGLDDFPVLKAFQQYIDAEQARARKRLLMLGSFFGVLMLLIIAVFVVMLHNASQRNQILNDRLVEFAMKDHDRDRHSAVVVQQPAQQDTSAILTLTAKLEDLQQRLQDSQRKAEEAERARAEAEKAASRPAALSAEEIEIRRLKALLAAEKKEKAAAQAQRRKDEIEAYRRKHYPELYEQPTVLRKKLSEQESVVDDDDDATLDDDDAIDYFKEESTETGDKQYSIPVDVRGSKSKWRIPD